MAPAKLLLALIQQWLLILSCWEPENRSQVKATKLVPKHAFHILSSLPHLTHLFHAPHLILPVLTDPPFKKEKHAPLLFSYSDMLLLNLMSIDPWYLQVSTYLSDIIRQDFNRARRRGSCINFAPFASRAAARPCSFNSAVAARRSNASRCSLLI